LLGPNNYKCKNLAAAVVERVAEEADSYNFMPLVRLLLHLVPHGYSSLAGDKGWGQKAYNSQSRERPMTAEDKTALSVVDNGSRRRRRRRRCRRRTADFMWGIKSVRLK
jgi:hypothetical protein